MVLHNELITSTFCWTSECMPLYISTYLQIFTSEYLCRYTTTCSEYDHV